MSAYMPIDRIIELDGYLLGQGQYLLDLWFQDQLVWIHHYCIYIQFIRMNVTMKENDLKKKDVVDQSRSKIKPAFFEMKQYQPHGLFEELSFMLIRPPRFIYNPQILKPPKRIAQRFNIQSFFIPFELTLYTQQKMRYVLLYLHGNGSSRFEGTLFLQSLPDGVGLACFDFNGCGNRTQAEYITLGQQQSKDVNIAAAFLKGKGYDVVGWGRSMGAVSLLMSSELDIMIADSAYSNLATLCKQSSSKFLPKACCCLFNCFFPCVFACIQCKVHNLAGLTISNMNVMKHLREMQQFKQICFLHGESDTLIPSQHANKLYQSFQGRKSLLLFQGTHNSTRPVDVIEKCFQFISQSLEERERRGRNRINSKIMEMATFQKQNQTNLNRVFNRSELKKSPSVSVTLQTKSSQPLASKNKREYSGFQSEQNSNLMKLEDSGILRNEKIPENFCSVLGSEDLQKLQQIKGGSKRARMGELFFEKK